MISQSHRFENSTGHELAAVLDLPPVGAPRAYALFAHCFTCNKDLRAVQNISLALTERGIAVLRFDFPGLGASGGSFEDSTFSTNVRDLVDAARFLDENADAPQILIGHSLGGAAAIRAAGLIDSIRAVATIGAPADPDHVTHLFGDRVREIRERGEATVSIANRHFTIRREFLEDVEAVSMEEATRRLGKALLILHSPVDEIVGIENAAAIYQRALHPKSFLSLDDADHLLTREADSRYVAQTIGAWSRRYLELEPESAKESDEVVARIGQTGYDTDLLARGSLMVADEPVDMGGGNEGPTPYEYLLSALGAYTAITLRMYADRKEWPLDAAEVRLRHEKIHCDDAEECGENNRVDRIERTLVLEGDLDPEQRQRLLEIAEKCPVHRTLEQGARVRTRLEEEP